MNCTDNDFLPYFSVASRSESAHSHSLPRITRCRIFPFRSSIASLVVSSIHQSNSRDTHESGSNVSNDNVALTWGLTPHVVRFLDNRKMNIEFVNRVILSNPMNASCEPQYLAKSFPPSHWSKRYWRSDWKTPFSLSFNRLPINRWKPHMGLFPYSVFSEYFGRWSTEDDCPIIGSFYVLCGCKCRRTRICDSDRVRSWSLVFP